MNTQNTYHISKLQLPYLMTELHFVTELTANIFEMNDEKYINDVLNRVAKVENVLEKIKNHVQLLKKVKYDIGFVVDYKFNEELPYMVDFYEGTLVGENVFMKEHGIEHIYDMEIEAYSPKHALQIATDSITGNKCFELYNHYTGDIECVKTILTNYCIGFIDEHLHNEFGEVMLDLEESC